MRLGKRERLALRQEKLAVQARIVRAGEATAIHSSWRRLLPINAAFNPVGKRATPWDWNWRSHLSALKSGR